MNLSTIIVTRSKSCSVKTLHTILKLNIKCVQKGIHNEISYVDDDPFKKADLIQKCMKKCDRLFFIDFSVSMDDESINQIVENHDNTGVLVFPGVKEGIDWGLFKHKVKEGYDEPIQQMGLNFDTEVARKISKDIYAVSNTEAKAWVMFPKNVIKSIKDKKGDWKIHPKMFEKFKEQGVKIYAFTAAKLVITYAHECVSNILNAAGVQQS
jgi:hypothetical protein